MDPHQAMRTHIFCPTTKHFWIVIAFRENFPLSEQKLSELAVVVENIKEKETLELWLCPRWLIATHLHKNKPKWN